MVRIPWEVKKSSFVEVLGFQRNVLPPSSGENNKSYLEGRGSDTGEGGPRLVLWANLQDILATVQLTEVREEVKTRRIKMGR
jgi:hypothetical protein